jgi:hypothetical protein
MIISIEFNNQKSLDIIVEPTLLGAHYIDLVYQNYKESFPIYRDRIKYNSEYLLKLAKEAKIAFNWDWELPDYNLSVTTALHKDLERLLGQTGFSEVPARFDNLIHELHYCLHIVQHPNSIKTRIGNLQIEWFNDSGFPLPSTFEFQDKIKFGDCLLQNPFVGHGPVQIDNENDWTELEQTCKFHTFVKPGIVIYTGPGAIINKHHILDKFKKHNINFVNKHTEQKILYYTGFPIIGQVTNTDNLRTLVECPDPIELTQIKFNE